MKINSILKKLFFSCSFLLGSFLLAQEKPLIIEELTPELYVHTTYNTFKGTKYSANGMYLITKKGVVLFDTPWDETQYQPILDSIKKRHNLPVIAVFASHSHEDRSGGFAYYNKLGIPTYATKETNAILKSNNQATSTKEIKLGKTYKIGGEQFVIEYFGEGHTVDNTVVWFPKYRILNGGCLIKSAEAVDLGNVAEANVNAWPNTIDKLMLQHPIIQKVIPGHDNWRLTQHLENTIRLLNKN
ncbi:BlaB/IND/MUS family subclass B1 metallo-beta-lactamase [Chishuiella changwenlii]|uniref:BlaB/IND/MUS family subclass B1 metallo-beta-lactamase n=1 Tax=Chishuiella changwenlii TaxID=1434701 RepID=UPI002FD96B0B